MKKNNKELFERYEAVRVSGVTNMFDFATVSALSGLTKEEIIFVIENYSKLKKLYGEENE